MLRHFLVYLACACVAFGQSEAEYREALIKHEGYSLRPYRVLGRLHIGIGHLLPESQRHTIWTAEQVEAAFRRDLNQACVAALAEIPSFPEHSREVRILLVELAFQCGRQGLHDFTSFRRAIGRFDYVEAARELRLSRMATQTPARVDAHCATLYRAASQGRFKIREPEAISQLTFRVR